MKVRFEEVRGKAQKLKRNPYFTFQQGKKVKPRNATDDHKA